MSHTPGPWGIAPVGGPMGSLDICPQGTREELATVWGSFTGLADDVVKANACLIAAAPDLLEALKGVVAVADRKTAEFDRARAAIAKAEGREP